MLGCSGSPSPGGVLGRATTTTAAPAAEAAREAAAAAVSLPTVGVTARTSVSPSAAAAAADLLPELVDEGAHAREARPWPAVADDAVAADDVRPRRAASKP